MIAVNALRIEVEKVILLGILLNNSAIYINFICQTSLCKGSFEVKSLFEKISRYYLVSSLFWRDYI